MATKYIPLASIPDKPFVAPVSDDYFIWWLFRNLCVECRRPATEINEIRPRSRGKMSLVDWKNRVTLCHSCHMEYHRKGVNDKAVVGMQQIRKDFLLTMGRAEYVNLFPD